MRKFIFLWIIGSLAIQVSGQVWINEICSSNSGVFIDPDFNDHPDWIELRNYSAEWIDIGGYYLSDDTANLEKYRIPDGTYIAPDGYTVFYADGHDQGMHTNFRLDKEGEFLALSDTTGQVLDSVSFPFLKNNMSWGRVSQYELGFQVYYYPTPGTENRGASLPGTASFVEFSVPGGFYEEPFMLGLSLDTDKAEIYYTTDGSLPTKYSTPYTDSIVVDSTMVIRAVALSDRLVDGVPMGMTYFFDEPRNLPVISFSTNPANLYSDESGIMVKGTNGRAGYCTDIPHNLSQDWERQVNVEFYEKDGTMALNQMCGIKIFGGCSRIRYPQKSFAFYARGEYESSSFAYRLFPDKHSDDYETFILRAAADDQPLTFFRDALTHMLVKDVIDVDMQAYRPVVVYINGEYYGISNMREKVNEHYVNDNFGIDPDSVDMLKRNGEQDWNIVSGDNEDFKKLMDFVRMYDMSYANNYEKVVSRIDIDEYINYMVTQIYLGARDWPGNNIKYWKSSVPPYDKWRWVLYDLDHHFKEFFGDIMEEATEADCGCTWPNPPWSTELFRRLLKNDDFRRRFVARFHLIANQYFTRDRMHAMVDSLQAGIQPEIPRHIERWGGAKVTDIENTWMSPVFDSIEVWENRIQRMHEFIDRRHETAVQQLNAYLGIDDVAKFTIAGLDQGQGTVYLDGLPVTGTAFSGYFTGGTHFDALAVPAAGYAFSHWVVRSDGTIDSVLIASGDSWRFDDSGEWPDETWNQPEFNDSAWNEGVTEFGYGDGDEATVVSYGADSLAKHLTTRFRTTFYIEDSTRFDRYEMRILRDDGVSVYLNGAEIVRDNQNRYYVGNDTPAEEVVQGEEENRWLVFGVNSAFIRNGVNHLAAEVHQVDRTSNDISFNLTLSGIILEQGTTEIIDQSGIMVELDHSYELKAVMQPAEVTENVFINEIQAANINGYVDEAGDFEDWIELYNGGVEPVDLAGLFLSDTLPAADGWQFPDGNPHQTTLGAGEYLVVVADNEPEEGLLHASFRLDKEGEEVYLFQRTGQDTVVLDHMEFGLQYNYVSYGRYPDGAPDFEFFRQPTPGMANQTDSDTVSMREGSMHENIWLYPNPSRGIFTVDLPADTDFKLLEILDTDGRVLFRQNVEDRPFEVNAGGVPPGVYLLKLKGPRMVRTLRFIIGN